MTGSCLGRPRFSASRPIQAAIWALRRVVARVRVGAAGADRGRRRVGHAAAPAPRRLVDRGGRRGRDRRSRGRRVATHADELDVGHVHVARDLHDLVLVVAFQRGELAVLDVAGEEADVPVGAEVLAVAPVVGDDVARARVGGVDDLQVVLLGLGVLDPGLHRRPAAAVHLVARLLERPRHEARAPRVAGADLGGRQVLVDLGAGVDALLVHAELGLRDLQRRGADAAGARARRGGGRGVHHARHRRRGGDGLRRAGGRLGGQERAGAALLRVHRAGGRGHELARVAGLRLGRRHRGSGSGGRRGGRSRARHGRRGRRPERPG